MTNDLPAQLRKLAADRLSPNGFAKLYRESADVIEALRSRLKLAEDVCEAVSFWTRYQPSYWGSEISGVDLFDTWTAWRHARDAKPKDAE